MMLSKQAIQALVRALSKRASADQVEWTQLDEGKYGVDLREFFVGISRTGDMHQPEPDILFEVDSADGRQIASVHVKFHDAEYAELEQLFEYADAYMQDWNRRILNAAKLIEAGSISVGGAVGASASVVASPPPSPKRPTEEQARTFFEKIAGRWTLEFETKDGSSRTEILEIDKAGNYFTDGRPRYRFALVSCDEQLEQVEVVKQELTGKVRQIEVLTVFPDRMEGYAKHDEHNLLYKRR